MPAYTRRYDLDWLRVIAFSLLIFYHIGMFYVTWGWHIKSQYMSSAAHPLMLTVNPWRLALLFFISGVVVRFATDRVQQRGRFALSRLSKLGLPVLGGVFLVVMPQAYFQLLQAGLIDPGIVNFYPAYLAGGPGFPIITPTWNHLWYVVYLLVYILLVLASLPWFQNLAGGRVARFFDWLSASRLRLLFVVPLPFILFGFTLSAWYPTTHALIDDWGNHSHRFTIFMMGYFVAKHDGFWHGIDRLLPFSAVACVGLWVVWIFEPEPNVILPIATQLNDIVEIVYAWASIALLLGLAQRYLRFDKPVLRYLTGAVFCYYILHQTIIIAVGHWLTPLSLGVRTEFLLVLTATVAGCVAGYEILKRIPYVRRVFGIQSALSAQMPLGCIYASFARTMWKGR
ncbi:MAG: acyltransferase family protein [Gammaproteobacteria bacterium]